MTADSTPDGRAETHRQTPPCRAILDTNVFVGGGFNRRSASAQLIEAARAGRLLLVWNQATRAETQRILDKIPRLSFAAVADIFTPAGEHTAPTDLTSVAYVQDPEDRKFAALSLEAAVPVVTSDDDLLSHADKLEVLKASAFLARSGLGNRTAAPDPGP